MPLQQIPYNLYVILLLKIDPVDVFTQVFQGCFARSVLWNVLCVIWKLTHLSLVLYMCINEPGQHLFR